MKNYTKLLLSGFAIWLAISSCAKNQAPPRIISPRTIKYILHTEKDFTDDSDSISFSIFIRTRTKTLFDSTLVRMELKDIPDSTQPITFEKKVPGDDGSDLAVGFHYTIDQVGTSSFIDSVKAGDSLKIVNFSFK